MSMASCRAEQLRKRPGVTRSICGEMIDRLLPLSMLLSKAAAAYARRSVHLSRRTRHH